VKNYNLRSINSLLLFGVRKECLVCERSLLMYQFTRRAIKLTAVIINFTQNFIENPSLKVKSIYIDEIIG
jgi:hypothetical protein